MKRVRLIPIVMAGLLTAGCALQTEMPVRTRVTRVEPGMTLADYAMYYSLPRTVFDIEMVVDKKITRPGPFAAYAERFLGLTGVPTRESVEYSVVEIRVSSHPEKDPAQMFRIETEGKPAGARISLTADGLIRGINLPAGSDIPSGQDASQHLAGRQIDYPAYTDLTLKKNTEPIPDTIYRLVRTDTSFLRIPVIRKQENQKTLLLQAGEAADILMKLREGRFKLLNGEYAYVENDGSRIPEGTSLEVIVRELAQMEEGYVSLFAGRKQTERTTLKFTCTPKGQVLSENFTLCSFSRTNGVEAPETAGGEPVVIRFTRDEQGLMDQVQWGEEGKEPRVPGLAYRIPEKTRVEVLTGGEMVFSREFLVAQCGRIDFIPANVLADESAAVEFYPAYGSVKGIFRR